MHSLCYFQKHIFKNKKNNCKENPKQYLLFWVFSVKTHPKHQNTENACLHPILPHRPTSLIFLIFSALLSSRHGRNQIRSVSPANMGLAAFSIVGHRLGCHRCSSLSFANRWFKAIIMVDWFSCSFSAMALVSSPLSFRTATSMVSI